MPTYSFLDINASISGNNGNFTLGGPGSGNTEGGITVTQTEDRNTMTIGAGGEGMHSLHAGKSGMVTVRLLKTSSQNNSMQLMFDLDTQGTRNHGQNTITIRDNIRGDKITCLECAFARFSDITYAKDGGENTWTFHSVKISYELGMGISVQGTAAVVGNPTVVQSGGGPGQQAATARARGMQSARAASRAAMVERAMAAARSVQAPSAPAEEHGDHGGRRPPLRAPAAHHEAEKTA